MKKIVVVLLALTLCVGMLAGCQSNEERKAQLVGTWKMEIPDTENPQALLDLLALLAEEIELVDMAELTDTLCVEFNMDGTYRFYYDIQASKDSVRAFYEDIFMDLYEGRSSLNAAYEMEFDAMSQEEFMQFQASIYEVESMEQLLDDLTEGYFDYDALNANMESGTYTINGTKIFCDAEGTDSDGNVKYSIEGDQLTLIYIDTTQVFTKVK